MKQFGVINKNCNWSRQRKHVWPLVSVGFSMWPSIENFCHPWFTWNYLMFAPMKTT